MPCSRQSRSFLGNSLNHFSTFIVDADFFPLSLSSVDSASAFSKNFAKWNDCWSSSSTFLLFFSFFFFSCVCFPSPSVFTEPSVLSLFVVPFIPSSDSVFNDVFSGPVTNLILSFHKRSNPEKLVPRGGCCNTRKINCVGDLSIRRMRFSVWSDKIEFDSIRRELYIIFI